MNAERKPLLKALYLDWNIFQDIIQKRKSPRLLENLNAGKRKGYKTPFSHIHMSDLLRCSNSAYVENDLRELEIITEQFCIGPHIDGSGFHVDKVPPALIYQAMKDDPRQPREFVEFKCHFDPYLVDRKKLSDTNIMIPFLERFNGFMTPALLESLIQNLLENGLSDHKLQRNFRNSFIEVVEINQPAAKQLREWPVYKYLFSDRNEIENNFNSILEAFLRISGKTTDSISEEEKFTTAYGILDFFPAFKEKIEKKNNLNNMLTDALHVYVASKCSYFVCGDFKSITKAKVVYRALGVKTRAYYVDDFISKIEL